MKFILDFDRTLFDVEQLYASLELLNKRHLAGTEESFSCVDFTQLLFPDVQNFFRTKQKSDIYILSSTSGLSGDWEADYQRKKISQTQLDSQVKEVFIMSGEKGPHVAEVIKSFDVQEQVIFIDDRIEHCLSVSQQVPHVLCFLLVRNAENIGDIHTIKNISVVHTLRDVDDSIGVL